MHSIKYEEDPRDLAKKSKLLLLFTASHHVLCVTDACTSKLFALNHHILEQTWHWEFCSHELILDQLSIYDQFQMITYTGMQDDICCHLCLEVSAFTMQKSAICKSLPTSSIEHSIKRQEVAERICGSCGYHKRLGHFYRGMVV